MKKSTLAKMPCCRHCGSERLKKNGHNASGSQRARCLECRRTFVLAPKPPPYSEAERERIVRAATCERMSTRAIRRIFGPCYQTLRGWIEKKSEAASRASRHARSRPKRRRARVR
jgi:transposase-like protein